MIQSIPLKKLVPSPRNVRKSSDVLADLQLRADIAARGLLQNLVVRKGKRGKFEVEAGGRRLAALQALAEEGTLSQNHEVTCLVIEGEESEVREASLAENVQRLAMNPADEAQAFASIIEAGATAAALYRDETGSSWKPVSGSRTSHSRHLTSAVIDARDFLRARAENRRHALIPEGTPIVFAGGRQTFGSTEDAKRYADTIWATLDKVRDAVPDLFLVHGGDGKGADRLAASWAERREVQQLTFSLDRRLGARAGFKRNEQMLSLNPRYVVAFPGNGVTERLVIDAKTRRITVVDRRTVTSGSKTKG